MISIVCSSITPNGAYKKEILNKIGLKNVEFLHYENKGEYSLSEIYEKGLAESQHDIVLFIHDDIILNTKNWGRKLIKHFETSNFGILGVAGTTKLNSSGTWWENKEHMVGIVNHKHNNHTYTSKYSANLGDKIVKTLLVDGVFFAVDKKRLKYQFNVEVKGFHFYDIDFTFGNHVNGCDVGVIFDIRITHLSIGQTNEKWEENKVNFVKKWEKNIPLELIPDMIYPEPKLHIKKQPKVSIIIPHINNHALLITCLDSLFTTNYDNFEIIVADTGSEDVNDLEDMLSDYTNLRLVKYDYYNFAKINNDVVSNHISDDSELLLFCNNDIEMINDAISIMVKYYISNKQSVGTVGCRLHFDNELIQHSGVAIYYRDSNKQIFISHLGINSYYGYNADPENVIGNTAAFLLINKHLFNKAHGFNEKYIECFEDVELNLEVLKMGKSNINISDAVCWHRESSTRSKSEHKDIRQTKDYNERLIPYINKNFNTNISKYIKIIQ